MPNTKSKFSLLGHRTLLFPVLLAFAPLFLRLWRFATCGAGCGADSFLGLFSDALTGGAFLVLMLACPRALRWLPALLWALFQVGSQELYQAMQRYPVWQDLHYLFDADFVRNSTGSFKLTAPLFTAILFLSAFAAFLVRLPKVRFRLLVWVLPALAVLFFAHARLEAGSSRAITAKRNPVHNFVLDAASGRQRSSSNATAVALPASLKQANLSGTSLLSDAAGKAKNVLIVVIEGIPGLYIPEIRKKMGVDDYEVTMDKLDKSTQGAMLIPDFTAHSHQTIRGLYAILCGDFSKLSFDTPKAFELLNMPERAAACLPAQLTQHGFSTHFLQAAGLGFMAKDRVMAAVGFNEVHGMEWFTEQKITNPFPFDWGIVDSTFFQGAQRYISKLHKSKQPWMLTLLTVGTHQPFGVPNDIAARYASPRDAAVALLDDAVANFLDKLKTDGTLDDTLVIVTSDESHGSPRWDWVSSWSLHMVLAPEQAALPRIKQGSYGLLDVEASVLDYFHFPLPAQIIGRSYFRNYDAPREMFSFTNMVLRRHTGKTDIRCAGGHSCIAGQTTSLIAQQPENLLQLPARESDETYALATALDNALRGENDIRQLSFASGEVRKIKGTSDSGANSDVLIGGNNIDLPANSDVTVHLKITLLEGPKTGVPFRLLVKGDRHILNYMLDKPLLPDLPDLPTLLPGESMEQSFSFPNTHKINQITFDLQADAQEGLVRIDRFDIAIKKQPHDVANSSNAIDEDALSELDIAAQLGNAERTRRLIERGANVNAADNHGVTALMRATAGGHADIVKILLDKRADPNAANVRSETALSIALKSDHPDIAEILIKHGSDPNAALIPLSWYGRVPLVEFLLEHGADINHTGGILSWWTPLMHAAYHGHNDLVRFLLDKGAKVNTRSNNNDTALSLALASKHTDIAELLLAKDDVNAALMPASWGGKLDVIQFLLAHGANINHMGGINVKWTPLMHAAYHGHADVAKLLLEKGANANITSDSRETALSIALERKRADIAEILVDKGANVNAALMPASWKGNLDAVQFLLEHGANINYTEVFGIQWTPLMHAAYHGHEQLVAFLLSKGADANTKDLSGATALQLALMRGNNDVANILSRQ